MRTGDVVEIMDGGKTMNLDLDALREDLKQECYGAFFGASIGGALIESFDVDRASLSELLEMTRRWGIDLRRYEI